MKNQPVFLIIAVTIIGTGCLYSQANQDVIYSGQVLNEQNQPLPDANVVITELLVGAATDNSGYFRIKLMPGIYTAQITYMGYETVVDSINVSTGQLLNKTYRMVLAYFEIGGIVVTAHRALIPDEAVSKTRITSGEIEHIQASSLSDVLKLVPGQRFDNPGLQELKQASIRTGDTGDDQMARNAFLGTQIILDDVPVSNNANMQLDTKANTSGIQRTTENSGIDLRQIPADNIEEVEVIRGIPSARYGDLTSGIIEVKTQSQKKPQRLKYKYNLQNQEVNLNGGFDIFGSILNYNFNLASSARDIRIPGYGYTRVAGQLALTNKLFANKLTTRNRVYYTRAFDEQDLREDDILQTERYNRDYSIRYTHSGDFLIKASSKLNWTYSLNYNHQNSYRKRLITVDHTYITDRMFEGTQEGHFIQSYISKLWVKGRAKNQYLDLKYSKDYTGRHLQHIFLTGLTYRRESNDGAGRIFDPNTPPSISSIQRDRPRSYNDLPALDITSIYGEDKISAQNFELNMGFRYEAYQPRHFGGGQFIQSEHGSFFNPRFNFLFHLSPITQLRFGYGVTSKAPPLSMLYPNDIYYDLDDINNFTGNDSTELVVVSTYIYSRENPDLKGYQQIKREISIDQIIRNIGISLTGYSSTTFGGFAYTGVKPIFHHKYDYPAWPDTSGRVIADSVVTTFSYAENSKRTTNSGVELSVQTKPFTPLKMRLRIEAAYNFTYSEGNAYDYATSFRYDPTLDQEIKPFWNPVTSWVESFLINYRAEFTIKELGAWVTLEAQQVVFDRDKNIGLSDSLAVGYISSQGEIIKIPADERSDSTYVQLTRTFDDFWYIMENITNTWVLNLRVSKALFGGSEVSFFVNNIFNYRPLHERQRTSGVTPSYTKLNPPLYFGVEFSSKIDGLFRR
ncbi:MAG: TonB-dependent receptor [Candidatus Marinimicrobia bacterium]|nr:TonB-dependent receptor [Candidatus Neomarinimicrobiota bacterium]